MKSVKFFLAAAAVLLAASCGRGGLGEGGLAPAAGEGSEREVW